MKIEKQNAKKKYEQFDIGSFFLIVCEQLQEKTVRLGHRARTRVIACCRVCYKAQDSMIKNKMERTQVLHVTAVIVQKRVSFCEAQIGLENRVGSHRIWH